MPRYIFHNGKVVEVPYARDLPRLPSVAPFVHGDMPAYKSPLGTGWIDGRKARREDLARGHCREADPSEFRPTAWSEENAKRFGLPQDNPPDTPQHVKDWRAGVGVERSTIGEFSAATGRVETK